ncbi:MAG: hypothetical protein ACOY3P_04450 [Planctomycetota bacterium]
MRTLIACFVLGLVASVASAAEPQGNIDQGTLAKMGLASMQVVSDFDGQAIRGKGYRGGGKGGYNGRTQTFSLYQKAYVESYGQEGKSEVKLEGPCDCAVPEWSANGALIVKYSESGFPNGDLSSQSTNGRFGGTSLTIVAAGSIVRF